MAEFKVVLDLRPSTSTHFLPFCTSLQAKITLFAFLAEFCNGGIHEGFKV
jgi:hypothetical protein